MSVPVLTGAVDKALALHAALRQADAPVRLSDLSRRTGMAKGTAHRLLATLVSAGMVQRVGQQYRAADAVHGDGLPIAEPHRRQLRALAPFLCDVSARTGLTVSLAVLHGTDVLFPYRVFGHRDVCTPADDRRRQPAHDTAAGRLLLALDNRTAGQHTALIRIRQTRMAVHESPYGTTCVAVPLVQRPNCGEVAFAAKGRSQSVEPEQVAQRLRWFARLAASRLQII